MGKKIKLKIKCQIKNTQDLFQNFFKIEDMDLLNQMMDLLMFLFIFQIFYMAVAYV